MKRLQGFIPARACQRLGELAECGVVDHVERLTKSGDVFKGRQAIAIDGIFLQTGHIILVHN